MNFRMDVAKCSSTEKMTSKNAKSLECNFFILKENVENGSQIEPKQTKWKDPTLMEIYMVNSN